VPLFDGQTYRGIMALGWGEPRKFDFFEIDVVQTIAAILTLSSPTTPQLENT